jgi:hypothetical protein
MNAIQIGLLGFAIAVPTVAVAQNAEQKACAVAAYTEYNKANLALLTQSLPVMSVEATIAQRRLQEKYCSEFARCISSGVPAGLPAETSNMAYAATFSGCLRREALETYDAKERGGD